MNFLAQISGEDIGRAFQNNRKAGDQALPHLIIFALIILSFVLAWLLVIYFRDRRRPCVLFHDLCELHDLSRKVQKQMFHVAKVHHLSDPALLFVCPDLVKRIQSQEMSEARSEKEKKRMEEILSVFVGVVFS